MNDSRAQTSRAPKGNDRRGANIAPPHFAPPVAGWPGAGLRIPVTWREGLSFRLSLMAALTAEPQAVE